MRSAISGLLRLAAVLGAVVIALPAHWVWPARVPPTPPSRWVMKVAVRLMGLRARLVGEPAAGPSLFVANHVSWADIFILSAAVDGSFVAKAEVRGWPVLGWLAARQATLFIDRTRRTAAGAQRDRVAERLARGGSVILFAEGTSSDGSGVLPFKSALFAAAVATGAPVQPVTIVWEEVGGEAIGDHNRLRIAWIGEMTLPPHLWRLVKGGGARARIVFHPLLHPEDFAGRADFARHARDVVASALPQAALRNRSE
jgi:1-acyl-sn-glycerol-3-phosphate acyltransferase